MTSLRPAISYFDMHHRNIFLANTRQQASMRKRDSRSPPRRSEGSSNKSRLATANRDWELNQSSWTNKFGCGLRMSSKVLPWTFNNLQIYFDNDSIAEFLRTLKAQKIKNYNKSLKFTEECKSYIKCRIKQKGFFTGNTDCEEERERCSWSLRESGNEEVAMIIVEALSQLRFHKYVIWKRMPTFLLPFTCWFLGLATFPAVFPESATAIHALKESWVDTLHGIAETRARAHPNFFNPLIRSNYTVLEQTPEENKYKVAEVHPLNDGTVSWWEEIYPFQIDLSSPVSKVDEHECDVINNTTAMLMKNSSHANRVVCRKINDREKETRLREDAAWMMDITIDEEFHVYLTLRHLFSKKSPTNSVLSILFDKFRQSNETVSHNDLTSTEKLTMENYLKRFAELMEFFQKRREEVLDRKLQNFSIDNNYLSQMNNVYNSARFQFLEEKLAQLETAKRVWAEKHTLAGKYTVTKEELNDSEEKLLDMLFEAAYVCRNVCMYAVDVASEDFYVLEILRYNSSMSETIAPIFSALAQYNEVLNNQEDKKLLQKVEILVEVYGALWKQRKNYEMWIRAQVFVAYMHLSLMNFIYDLRGDKAPKATAVILSTPAFDIGQAVVSGYVATPVLSPILVHFLNMFLVGPSQEGRGFEAVVTLAGSLVKTSVAAFTFPQLGSWTAAVVTAFAADIVTEGYDLTVLFMHSCCFLYALYSGVNFVRSSQILTYLTGSESVETNGALKVLEAVNKNLSQSAHKVIAEQVRAFIGNMTEDEFRRALSNKHTTNNFIKAIMDLDGTTEYKVLLFKSFKYFTTPTEWTDSEHQALCCGYALYFFYMRNVAPQQQERFATDVTNAAALQARQLQNLPPVVGQRVV